MQHIHQIAIVRRGTIRSKKIILLCHSMSFSSNHFSYHTSYFNCVASVVVFLQYGGMATIFTGMCILANVHEMKLGWMSITFCKLFCIKIKNTLVVCRLTENALKITSQQLNYNLREAQI